MKKQMKNLNIIVFSRPEQEELNKLDKILGIKKRSDQFYEK